MEVLMRARELYREEGSRGVLSGIGRFLGYRLSSASDAAMTWLFDAVYGPGSDVMAEDWDTLVLLDACRYDIFEEVNDLEGELRPRTTQAGSSVGFVKQTFADEQLHDTVYVTGNPFVDLVEEGTFHAVIDDPLRDEFDFDRGTVPPEAMTEAALEAHEAYPNKRVVVHYMQPHAPPLGETADRIDEEIGLAGVVGEKDISYEGTPFTQAAEKGLIDPETARQAYAETLEIVLDEVKTLTESVTGKVVVSADHAEHLGERLPPSFDRVYGHGTPDQMPRTPWLCTVPWFVLPHETRRRVRADPPEIDQARDEQREEKLRALGYV